MKEAYLINLEGMGDTSSALVDKEVFEWIESKKTPGRRGKESSWYDESVPAALHEALKKESFYERPYVTSGSMDNDRAMLAVSAPTAEDGSTGVFYQEDMERDVRDWAREHGFEIRDIYVGGLY